MTLTSKRYEKFYETRVDGADKISTEKLTAATSAWATEKAEGCKKYLNDPILAPLIYQLQQMQDEIDYLRTEIALNKSKTTFPGLGTTSTTALAGDTKLISLGSNTTYTFSDLVENRGVFTIRLTATSRGTTKVLDLRLV
jgi:hypothetical protein